MKQTYRGFIFIVSSPSGAGKTSLCGRLLAEFSSLRPSISVTTRLPRLGETNGKEYYFVSQDEMQNHIDNNDFLEWAVVHGNRYGSLNKPVINMLEAGIDVLFDIDWQGAEKIAHSCNELIVKVFILPPSLKELKKRLINRSLDDMAVINQRLENARKEIEHAHQYPYIIINDDYDQAYDILRSIYIAERTKSLKNYLINNEAQSLLNEDC